MKYTKLMQLLTLGLLSVVPVNALTIDDASSAKNDRFANNASFVMDDYDLSGIGISDDADRRWATLVSENVFVSAFHFFPTNGSTITFYKTNDPAGASVTREVASGQRIGSTDIYVGVLEDPVPVGYAFYEFATETINNQTDFNGSVYHDKNAFIVGRSPFSPFTGDQDYAIGRNKIDHWSNSINVSGTTAEAIMTERNGESDDVEYEATLVGGDSGAPLLIDLDESDTDYSLRIVGTNWFVGAVGDPSVDVNGFTYLGNHDEQIQAFIDLHAVPEPGTALLLAFASTAMIARRRRG